MDGTLVAPPGFRGDRYIAPTLAESPCLEPLCRWLRAGGRLLAVTSDDGNGPLRRIIDPLPAELRERVLLSTSDGAALFRVSENGTVAAVQGYAEGMQLDSDSAYLEEVYLVAQEIYLDFFRRMASEPEVLESMDDNIKKSYEGVLERVRLGHTTLERALSVDNLLRPGGVRKRGTLIWRTQAGPRSVWAVHTGQPAVQGSPEHFEQLCARELVAPFTSVVLLGLPRHLSGAHCEAAAVRLESLGLVASRAPNSVWLKRPGANKAVPIRWLTGGCEAADAFCFSARDAVAFGDNPLGNDGPLGEFSDVGMPFVSCGEDASWTGLQVGGLEAGTAAVVERMSALMEAEVQAAQDSRRAPRSFSELGLDIVEAVGHARAALAERGDRGAVPASSL